MENNTRQIFFAAYLKFSAPRPMTGVTNSEIAMQLTSSSASTTASTGATGGSGSATEIERLQRQLKNLQKSLADLSTQGLPATQLKEQQQLLSQQIQIVQAQIARLQSQKGLEQAEKRIENKQSSATGGNSATTKAQVTDKVTGSSGTADVRHQARQQSSHPASTTSTSTIEPADPPQVSILA
uniref:FlxA-like protein n=1 Tax=Ralstonia solanacearum TaxID=305 RepID=A0A0S4TPH4_RALSL|nr:conserved protein of unknown function [Ralstonia solanacearum]